VAVSFVVNVEEGAELSVADGNERNEAVYEVTDEVRDAPDPCRDSHFEYGTRVGYWRIMRLLDLYAVPATLNACGRSVLRSPWLARDAVTRGHEVACHGWR
jgi:allantoinase